MDLLNINNQNDKDEGKLKIINILAFIMLLTLVMGVALFVWLKSNSIDIRNVSVKELIANGLASKEQKVISGCLQEIKLDPKEHAAFTVYKDYIVKCTRDNIWFYNKEGLEIMQKSLQINNPVPKAAGSELLISDYGGREVYVFKDKDIKWYRKADGNIISADINEKGYVSLLHEAKGYKAAVTVMNLQGSPFFTRNVTETYLTGAIISPSGKHVLISSLDASGVQAGSQVELMDILGKPAAQKRTFENDVFVNEKYLGSDSVVLASDSSVICMDEAGKDKWSKDYGSGKIYSMEVALGRTVILAVHDDEKSGLLQRTASEVSILNMKGEQSAVYKLDGQVINVSAYDDDIIAVNNGREVHFINTGGKLIAKYFSKIDIEYILFFNKQQAAVFTKSSVQILDIRGKS